MEDNNASPVAQELKETLSRCGTDARIVEDLGSRIRMTNIPHSGTHMLPGGMSTLEALGNHWEDWEINYVDNDDTVMYGSKSDKDVIIRQTA